MKPRQLCPHCHQRTALVYRTMTTPAMTRRYVRCSECGRTGVVCAVITLRDVVVYQSGKRRTPEND